MTNLLCRIPSSLCRYSPLLFIIIIVHRSMGTWTQHVHNNKNKIRHDKLDFINILKCLPIRNLENLKKISRSFGEEIIHQRTISNMCAIIQSYMIICDPMNCAPPGSSVHGISQARILEWVAISSSRGSSQPRNQTCVSCVSCVGRQIIYHQHHMSNTYVFKIFST